MAKKNQKVVKFHKTSYLNIGIIIFIIIFIYMLYNVFLYFTMEKVAAYEVSQGTITQNRTYTGVIFREEKVFNAERSGYINYFNKDATKLGVGNYVYSIDETGNFFKEIQSKNDGKLFSEKDSYRNLEKTAENYVLDYSNQNFYQVYTFRYDMEARLMEALNENLLSDLKESAGNNGLYTSQTTEPGIVVYHTDGLEEKNVENFTKDIFDESAYAKNSLIGRGQINAGEPAYKLITSEIWDLVIPIEKSLASELEKESNIKVKFKKDNTTAWGVSKIIEQDNAFFLHLNFQNSGLRFATDRYLEVELIMSDIDGLKIPNTALTEKGFFLVPKKFLTKQEDSNSTGVMRRYKNEDGEIIDEFVSITIGGKESDKYYIAGDSLRVGDVILTDSNKNFTLGEKISLQGVYNINQGYTIFRTVEILFQNKEYTIIKTGTNYGISLYDHIVLDASATEENKIIQ